MNRKLKRTLISLTAIGMLTSANLVLDPVLVAEAAAIDVRQNNYINVTRDAWRPLVGGIRGIGGVATRTSTSQAIRVQVIVRTPSATTYGAWAQRTANPTSSRLMTGDDIWTGTTIGSGREGTVTITGQRRTTATAQWSATLSSTRTF